MTNESVSYWEDALERATARVDRARTDSECGWRELQHDIFVQNFARVCLELAKREVSVPSKNEPGSNAGTSMPSSFEPG